MIESTKRSTGKLKSRFGSLSISILLHFIFVIFSGLSFLWANASVIETPAPIKLTFIGSPNANTSPSPKETINKSAVPPVLEKETKTQEPKKPLNEKPKKKLEKPKAVKDPLPKKIEEKIEKVKEEESKDLNIPEDFSTQAKNVESNVESATKSDSSSEKASIDKAGIEYEKALLTLLSKSKRYPERARRRGVSGDGAFRLELNRNGSVKHLKIVRSTGSDILDKELLALVNRASPLPPLPPSYQRTEFIIPVRFAFSE